MGSNSGSRTSYKIVKNSEHISRECSRINLPLPNLQISDLTLSTWYCTISPAFSCTPYTGKLDFLHYIRTMKGELLLHLTLHLLTLLFNFPQPLTRNSAAHVQKFPNCKSWSFSLSLSFFLSSRDIQVTCLSHLKHHQYVLTKMSSDYLQWNNCFCECTIRIVKPPHELRTHSTLSSDVS